VTGNPSPAPHSSQGGPSPTPDALRHARHELRTPINHIVGYAELLLEETGGDDPAVQKPMLDAIRGAAMQALTLINDALDPSSTAAARPPAAVAGALRPLLDQITANTATLSRQAAERGAGGVVADVARIESAVNRLLGLIEELLSTPAGLLSASNEPAAERPPSHEASAHGVILVVDDDEANRDMLARRLDRLGYTVLRAEDGRQALDTLAAEPVDLVLLDIMMPDITGYEVLERRRADPRLRDIPVVMISAVDELDSVVRCIELGAEDYLPKPFDPVLLRARVGACLEQKRMRDQEHDLLATIQAMAEDLRAWNRTLETRVQEQVAEVERLNRLRRFLSPQLAEVIVSSGDERLLESHRREITMVFCDLRGFTAFAETAEPEDVIGVLHEYHMAMGPLIAQHEGTLERFAGDGMMVFFNDPLPCPDPARRAVRMAIGMRDRATELSQGWRRLGHTLEIGIGIAMGYATCGKIGFEGRFDYGAIGTVTNLAARLCDQAGPGQILAGQRVVMAVEDLIEHELAGELTLKGFARPVPSFAVLSLRTPPEPEEPADSSGAGVPAGLTVREVEVLRLIVAGKTNPEIAESLVLSVHTVERHVANLYGKIGAHTRAEAATYALRHGLV
jgi:adenylate cyclase